MNKLGLAAIAATMAFSSTPSAAQVEGYSCEQAVRDLVCYNDRDVERCVQWNMPSYCPGEPYVGPNGRWGG